MKPKFKIPKIPNAFFKWYCQSEKYEELHGDLEELFNERAEDKSLNNARWHYLFDVIRCCQPYAWKKSSSSGNMNVIMFKNYYKISLRSLIKNPLSSFINIFGLSAAIGVCLVVYAFFQHQNSMDQFHENKNEVYLATFYADWDGVQEQFGLTPRPLGDMLKEDFTHIKKVCRLEDQNVVLKYEDNVFHEKVRFSDPEFLEMFTFPLKWGTPGSLTDLNSIILSDEMSKKYFGDENPVGRDMLMILSENRSKALKVTGVVEAFPKAHDIEFDFLINFQNLRVLDLQYNFSDWKELVNATLIQVDNPNDLIPIEAGMEKYRLLHNEVDQDRVITAFAFEQLATLYETSDDIRGAITYNYSAPGRLALPIIALFMIALACFNYINIAIVSAAKRLKEIGVRKVMGANRGRVIIQFLAENVLVTAFALILGFILGIAIFLPWFVELSELPLDLKLVDKNLWIFLAALMLATGLTSGMYPALYISKFEVAQIFKGSIRFGRKNPLTKTLLGFQLVFACILIVGGVMFTQNTTYQATRSWGYNQSNALYASVEDQVAYERLHAALLQDQNVLAISGSQHHLGKDMATTVIHRPDRQYDVQQLAVDANYFETMGLQLADGRVFRDQSKNDKKAVIMNEFLVKNMVLQQPVGELFEIDSIKYEVVGVVKDFHARNLYHEIRPTIFTLADRRDFRYLSLKARSGSEASAYETLKGEWATLFPEIPFQGGHQEDVWGVTYMSSEADQGRFMRAVAFLAVLLASLGLYGLVTLNVSGRVMEFSIRKVLGAGVKSIAASITKQYVVLSLVALFIGLPISYVLIGELLEFLYAYPMPLTYSGMIISAGLLLLVLFTVIATQVSKVFRSNPVEGLRVEK